MFGLTYRNLIIIDENQVSWNENVGSAYQSNNNKKKKHEAEDDCETCACAPPQKKNQWQSIIIRIVNNV